MTKKLLVAGCLIGASFFVACQQQDASKEENTATNASAEGSQDKELEMYEASELASLMRQMYEGNLDLKKQIAEGKVPESFPEEWKKIHTAEATNPEELNETFDALAKQYIANMESIAEAKSTAEAKIAYNAMVGTCASCHQIYCTGPLAKIKKMRFSQAELAE